MAYLHGVRAGNPELDTISLLLVKDGMLHAVPMGGKTHDGRREITGVPVDNSGRHR